MYSKEGMVMLVMLSRNFREITFRYLSYEYYVYCHTRPTHSHINIYNIFVSHEFLKISKKTFLLPNCQPKLPSIQQLYTSQRNKCYCAQEFLWLFLIEILCYSHLLSSQFHFNAKCLQLKNPTLIRKSASTLFNIKYHYTTITYPA